MKAHIIVLSIFALLFISCAGQKKEITNPTNTVSNTGGELSQSPEPEIMSPTLEIANRCNWPELLPDEKFPETLAISSGTDDGVWVEGKGYILKSIEQLVQLFNDGNIVAPLNMTNNYTIENFVSQNGLTTYDIRVKVKYIITVEFVLTWSIVPIMDDTQQVIAYDINAHKSSGSSYIKEISHRFIIRKLEEKVTSLELTSFNKAAMDKEEEARAYVEDLFARLIAN